MAKARQGKINDPEDTAQTSRIKAILKRRDAVLEARDVAKEQFHLNGVSKVDAVMHYQSRLETLIVDLHTKFQHDLAKADKDYLNTVEIDRIIIPPPDDIADQMGDLADGADIPDPQTTVIRGLEWFIQNEPIVTAEFTVSAWNPPREKNLVEHRVLGFETIDSAVMTCFEFMDNIGIDATLSAMDYTGGDEPGL